MRTRILSLVLAATLADGGTKNAPVVYRAAEGEIPVITSAVPVTGWRKLTGFPDGTPEVAEMPTGLERFHVLFINTQHPLQSLPRPAT